MEGKIRLAVFGQKRLSREGGIEIVVKELCTRMAQKGCDVTCYNRAGHHVSGAEYDKTIEYDGIRQKVVPTIEKKGLAAVSSSFFAALYSAFGRYDVVHKDDVVSEIIEKAAPVPDNSAQDYSDVPVYYEPFSYAKENDEVDLYRTSYRLNGECKQAIHEAIADNYDGMYLGDGAVDQVVRQYGMERVGYILANTLHHKNYDGRFSHSNKEWAEQVGTPENNARIIKFRADWVVTSHSAVLDGFVTMYREKLEKQKELEQPFVKRFYVVENRQAVPLEIKRFGNLNDAMSQYQALPNHYMKALGVEKNPDPLPGSLDILQCRNGLDTIVEDYKTVPGWNNPYIQNHVVQPLQGALAVQEVELAYKLPDAYGQLRARKVYSWLLDMGGELW